MKTKILILLTALVLPAFATSYLITLEEKLSRACIIAKVKVESVALSEETAGSGSYCIFRVSVGEVYKGSHANLLEFYSHTYSHLAREKLPALVGDEFLIFLHDPYENKRYWLFEGPRGMRPVAKSYNEYILKDNEVITESYPEEDYLKILRNLKQ